MTVRSIVAGALGAALFMTVAAADAFAAKKGGMCKAAEKPQCNLVLRADCIKQNKCGCQKWVCRL
jgi:hypothetical protein